MGRVILIVLCAAIVIASLIALIVQARLWMTDQASYERVSFQIITSLMCGAMGAMGLYTALRRQKG